MPSDNEIWRKVFANVRTLDEAYRLDDELSTIERENFRMVTREAEETGISLPERVKPKISSRLYQILLDLQEKRLLNFDDQDQVRLFFQNAHRVISQVPRLQIQVSIEVNEQILNTIYGWVRKEVEQTIFLDIVYKPQILAGCVIVYKGVFRDYSLRGRLEKHGREIFKPIMDRIQMPALGADNQSTSTPNN